MKKIICLLALASLSVTALPRQSAAAEEVGACGDNLRKCISKSNVEWRRTHDDDELEQSHSMCNVEWTICIILSII